MTRDVQFRIADTFTDSLARLTGDEQKAAKTTAFDLQLDPSAPGLSFHKLDRAKDKNFWSVRVNREIRLIVHRSESSIMLAYVGHHDAAYRWAERRRIERHPKTGAAQIVEVRETVREIEMPRVAAMEAPVTAPPAAKPALFADTADDVLLGYGVPQAWLEDIRRVDEDSVLDIAVHLPAEAGEALVLLATGGTPALPALTTDRASRVAPIPLFHACRRHYPGGAGRRPPKDVRRYHASFSYQAGTWDKPRRVVAKIEWHPGELYPRVGFIVTNLGRPAERVVAFYNQRGTAEQWIKEGKNAIQWTRLSCRRFDHNAVRLQLHALAYNLGNFMRTLALPDTVEQWSLTSLREKLIKIGAKIVRHGRYVTFQMAEVVIPRDLFADILRRIDRLRPPPAPA